MMQMYHVRIDPAQQEGEAIEDGRIDRLHKPEMIERADIEQQLVIASPECREWRPGSLRSGFPCPGQEKRLDAVGPFQLLEKGIGGDFSAAGTLLRVPVSDDQDPVCHERLHCQCCSRWLAEYNLPHGAMEE